MDMKYETMEAGYYIGVPVIISSTNLGNVCTLLNDIENIYGTEVEGHEGSTEGFIDIKWISRHPTEVDTVRLEVVFYFRVSFEAWNEYRCCDVWARRVSRSISPDPSWWCSIDMAEHTGTYDNAITGVHTTYDHTLLFKQR